MFRFAGFLAMVACLANAQEIKYVDNIGAFLISVMSIRIVTNYQPLAKNPFLFLFLTKFSTRNVR